MCMDILMHSLALVMALSAVVFLPCIIIARVNGPIFPWLADENDSVSS